MPLALSLAMDQPEASQEAVDGHVRDHEALSTEEDRDLQGTHPGTSELERSVDEVGSEDCPWASRRCRPGDEAIGTVEGIGSAPPVDGGAGHTEDHGGCSHRLLMGIVHDTFSVSHWGDHSHHLKQ